MTLTLDKNNITYENISNLVEYLKSVSSISLKHLSLDNNPLQDSIQIIADALIHRHEMMIHHSNQPNLYQIPLEKLSLVKVRMQDKGLDALIAAFESLHRKNISRNIHEYS